jgi:hypothetical protein
MAVHQPFTTDVTIEGLKRARNAMREKLWADPAFAHMFLVHDDGKKCPDGCDTRYVNHSRLELYQSELEP